MSEVLIAIVLRDNLALSKLAIKSALAQQPACDVLCVNNASSDGTASFIATKNVATISFQKQVSLSACWNAALKAAWRSGYRSVLMLNNDAIVRPDTAATLDALNEEFLTCVSVNSEDQVGTPGDRSLEDLQSGKRRHPDYSCWMMRKSVTDKGLWFNEDYFPAFCEDSDHHARCHRAGVECFCVDLPFFHYSSATLKQASEKEAIIIRKGADRNRERFRQKYGCLPGTPEYEKLFSPETFGVDNRRVRADTPEERLMRQPWLGLDVCPDCAHIAKNFGWPPYGYGIHLPSCPTQEKISRKE